MVKNIEKWAFFAQKCQSPTVPRSLRARTGTMPIFRLLASLLFVFGALASAQAKLNVVATLSDLGSLAREIGGDKVDVTVLAKPTEDPHFVDARPSFVV